MNTLTTNNTLCCAYCGHYLGDANPIQYINNQPICAMCLMKMYKGVKDEEKIC